jgi:hypothetical protein
LFYILGGDARGPVVGCFTTSWFRGGAIWGGAGAGGGAAGAPHGGKLALRSAVTPSPEPFSNVALSFGEDVTAIGLTWFAAAHPYLALGMAIILVGTVVLVIRWVWRALKRSFRVPVL